MTAPYTMQTWANGSTGHTPLSARRMGVIEQGIFDATAGVIALENTIGDLGTIEGVVQSGSGSPGVGTPTFPPLYLDTAASPKSLWAYDVDSGFWVETRSVVSIQFGTGAPDDDTPTSPALYADIGTSPYTIYIYHLGSWQAMSGVETYVQHGSSAPDGDTPLTPVFYVNTASTPKALYWYNGSTWNLLGDGGIASLVQFASGTPGLGTATSPSLYANTDTTPYQLYAYGSGTWHLVGDGNSYVQSGAGAPDGGTPTSPLFYVDTTATPYAFYWYDGSVWNQLGDGVGTGGGGGGSVLPGSSDFLQLSIDVPNGTPDINIYLGSDGTALTNGALQGGSANAFYLGMAWDYRYVAYASGNGSFKADDDGSGGMSIVSEAVENLLTIVSVSVVLDNLAVGDVARVECLDSEVRTFVKVNDDDDTLLISYNLDFYGFNSSGPFGDTITLKTSATDVSVKSAYVNYVLTMGTEKAVSDLPADLTTVAANQTGAGEVTVTWDELATGLGVHVYLVGTTSYQQWIAHGTSTAVFTGVANDSYTVLAQPINHYGITTPTSAPTVVVS